MIASVIEDYARECERDRAKAEISDKPDFKVFNIEGTAYLQPLNSRAVHFLAGYDSAYKSWFPLRLTARDIEAIADAVKNGAFKVSMETIN